jgi:hypothetical protein
VSEAEREYAEARAAYDAALARLSAAKLAMAGVKSLQRHEFNRAVWQAYLDGERDYRVIAAQFGRSRAWVSQYIRGLLRERGFRYPETLQEHRYRIWAEDALKRARAKVEENRARRLDLFRRIPIDPNHSEAWHQVYEKHLAALEAELEGDDTL